MATAKNDVTGDLLKSKLANDKYSSGYDLIWGKKKEKDPNCNICGKNLETTKECAWTGCSLNWDEKRVDTVGQNGNEGTHYEYELDKSTGEVIKKEY
jgi:hypothetical protein